MVTSAMDCHQRPLYLGLDVGIDASAARAEHVGLVDAVAARDAEEAERLMAESSPGPRIASSQRYGRRAMNDRGEGRLDQHLDSRQNRTHRLED